MGGIVSSKPKKNKKLERQLQEQEEAAQAREDQLKKESDARLRARRGRAAGRRSLLSGLETGIVGGQEDKLG